MAYVAQKAGVHVTTVSLALRNHPSLPVATRTRLQQLARELGYQPDPALRALMAYRRQSVPKKSQPPLAYLTHWGTEWGWKNAPAHAEFFRGATARARTFGYNLEHFWLGEPDLSPRRVSDILLARGIAGLIIASYRPTYNQRLDFAWSKFSAVKIDYFPDEPPLHRVTNNQRAIGQLAVQRVIAAGYRRIGFVAPRWWDEMVNRAWSAGILAEQRLLDAKDQVPPLFFPDGPGAPLMPTGEGGDYMVPREAFERWFREHRPEVLISYAPLVMPLVREMGLSIPRDVAYVDIFLKSPDGRVAGVHQNCHRVGELSVEILAGHLQQYELGIPSFPTTTLVDGMWFDGESLPPRSARTGARRSASVAA